MFANVGRLKVARSLQEDKEIKRERAASFKEGKTLAGLCGDFNYVRKAVQNSGALLALNERWFLV